ncbi:hypothetical protein IMG5_128790 [Ichthyophthirius multifiliis]|uniref:Uncharacterized protein n=1 Tax=Ichthyophthirius multifiliis TaxID=5932 RepID=G0QW24_ICHMU|nr:hypothetical protein IMG5_128790 [Ichthyophthirius multifiliis]EGR30576.1 hypothetical protein IMG5_128790 [Ichthyophthirius multifiliis]|eukprot:XP_004032163.1 hypothetical protein IMG5_128790 [Ichthyophthirius multifiliis]
MDKKKFTFREQKYLPETEYEKSGHNIEKFEEYDEDESEFGFTIIDKDTKEPKHYDYNILFGWVDVVDGKNFYYNQDGEPITNKVPEDMKKLLKDDREVQALLQQMNVLNQESNEFFEKNHFSILKWETKQLLSEQDILDLIYPKNTSEQNKECLKRITIVNEPDNDGETFEGYILIDDQEILNDIIEIHSQDIRLSLVYKLEKIQDIKTLLPDQKALALEMITQLLPQEQDQKEENNYGDDDQDEDYSDGEDDDEIEGEYRNESQQQQYLYQEKQ